MLDQNQGYRAYLRQVLEQRIGTNARYSLRAFARDLRISPQMLSFVLNGKKALSVQTAAMISERLGHSPTESTYFVDLVALESKTAQTRRLAEYRIAQQRSSGVRFRALESEAFSLISGWHHFAILELIDTESFKSDRKWIAKRLGVSVLEVSQALERLERLQLLQIDKGRFVRTDPNVSATFEKPSAALRKLAHQLLTKAADALESQDVDERDITSMTMAIDPTRLPEAKKMIADFRRRLCAFLEQGERTEVYAFAPSLFRLTQKQNLRGLK